MNTKMMEYTKGDWKVDIRVGCVAVYADNETTRSYLPCIPDPSVCVYYKSGEVGEDGWQVDKELIANAHLIAAAPMMYEALEFMLERYRTIEPLYSGDEQAIEKAEKALAKAVKK